jgi:endo-1,4-beta-xylanase
VNNHIRSAVLCLCAALGSSSPLLSAPLRVGAEIRGRYVGAAVAMNPFRNETAYRDTLGREFNMLVAENAMKFDAMHPSQNTYNFTDADALVAYAEANGMAVRGHTLVWHSQLPGWLTGGNFNRDQTIAIMRDHISTVVGRYRGRIVAWDVVNEAISDNNGQPRTDSFWHQRIGPEYIAMAFQFAREADPAAILYYNDYEAEGSGAKSDAVFNLVSGLLNQGAPIDGVGWQWHKINGANATITSAHTNNAARLAALGLELTITEADVRIQLPNSAAKLTQQANEYRSLWNFCVNTATCRGVVTWGFTDKYSWVPSVFGGFGDALILDANYQVKPAYTSIQQLLEGGTQVPPPPTGLTATAGNAQVQLSWNASTGATSYNVKRSTTSGGPYATVGSPTSTSFTNTNLTNGTTYFYVVSAVGPGGESLNSGQVPATPQAPQTPNFLLSASPSSLTVARGASGTSTIGIARTAFTAGVAITASGLPTGVTATFNPSSTTGNSSTLTLAANGTATLGVFTVTITGTGGGLTRTTTLALTVNQVTSNFTLSANPTSVSVARGATATSTLAVARTNFTGSVAFTASGLPAGVSAAFNPTATMGASSVVTFSASATATLGAATVTLTGTSGTTVRTTTVSLTVTTPPSGGVVTVTPVINASGPWFNEEAVRLANTAPLTALTVTVVIQRTTGVSFSGIYNTVGGQIQQSNSSTTAAVTYTWTLAPGQTLGIGTNRLFAAQTGGTGTVHPTAGDTWTVTYTSGGASFTQSGNF